jgi:hypothetical protein
MQDSWRLQRLLHAGCKSAGDDLRTAEAAMERGVYYQYVYSQSPRARGEIVVLCDDFSSVY